MQNNLIKNQKFKLKKQQTPEPAAVSSFCLDLKSLMAGFH
jgi:hypothetical protein